MESRKRGNPAGHTNTHVAANLKHARRSIGMDLRTLSAKIGEAGWLISASAISKIENGDRRVDVDDLTVLAYALGTTPAALLTPPEDAVTLTGVPEVFAPEEVQAWLQGRVKLTTGDLVRYWTEQGHDSQSYIYRYTISLEQYDQGQVGITPREEYEERIAKHRERVAFINNRLFQLDPNSKPLIEHIPDPLTRPSGKDK